MKKIVSIALAIALICFMIASTAFANDKGRDNNYKRTARRKCRN